jgi:hypothetical protein
MMMLVGLIIFMHFCFACGGSIKGLGRAQFRYSILILAGLGLQILVFSGWWQERVAVPGLDAALYALSMLILGVAVWLNRRLPGFVVLGLGWLCNAAVILANGGHMPVAIEALRFAALVPADAGFEALRVTNSSLIVIGTPLWFLGDVLALPAGVPLANVFSLGDVLIGLGAAWFLWATTRGAEAEQAPEQTGSVTEQREQE